MIYILDNGNGNGVSNDIYLYFPDNGNGNGVSKLFVKHILQFNKGYVTHDTYHIYVDRSIYVGVDYYLCFFIY